ncbi:MAG: prolipoprotein diacylglyceryl transferase [Bacteroidetes bacterium]|nr:prolipoprotein diacylglyceryl transferase [Bacteroidota bacterium]
MIASFGLFLVLAFVGAYIAFRAEYRRKGIDFSVSIHPLIARLGLAVIVGLSVAKLVYRLRRWETFIGSPQDFIYSPQGDWWPGLIAALATALLYRPRQLRLPLMDGLLLYCGVSGFLGAAAFAAVEDPLHIGIHGLNFYGALLAGTATFLYINKRHGVPALTAVDTGSPGMMLAYAIGRLGCHFAGDGDWGIVNFHTRPTWLGWLPDWAWAWRYPHNSIRQGAYIPGCTGGFCTQLPDPVYPTPLYEAVICLIFFAVLWAIRRRISRPGLLFALYAVLNGCERFFIEFIRVTPRYHLGDLSLSQAQLIALGCIITGLAIALHTRARRPVAICLLLSFFSLTGHSQPRVTPDTSITNFFRRDTGWIASDGCISIPLSDHRVLWMMGDSYIDNYNKTRGTVGCLFQVRNSALLQPLGNWDPKATSTLVGKGPKSFLRNDTRDNHLLWPTGGFQQDDTVYIYADNIVNATGGLGFASGGRDFLARLRMPDLAVLGYDSLPDFGGASFGLGFDSEEKGEFVYTWGIKSGYIESHVVVARLQRSRPRSPWSFWNGHAWDTAVAHMADVATGASNGTYVAKVGQRYVLVSTEFSVACDQGTHIYVATSDSITGPFSPRRLLYTIPDRLDGHTPFFYGPAIHPEYINAKGELLVTYDINGYNPCIPDCVDGEFIPDHYRPRGIRVPLSLLTPRL